TTLCPCSPTPSPIASNFNGTRIASGTYIWFNSIVTPSGLGSSPVTIRFDNSTIAFTANDVNYVLNVPSAQVRFDPEATVATTSFDPGTNTWETTTPPNVAGNTFLDGLAFQVPVDLPGGINPVTWSGSLSSDTSGVRVSWKWAAAVYTKLSSDNNSLGVKPVDDNKASVYKNSDHAGTPENFKAFVIGGARGGGGSNFTGGYSGTRGLTCCCMNVSSFSIHGAARSLRPKTTPAASGGLTARGTLLAAGLGEEPRGIGVRIRDSMHLDQTFAFASSDCETSRSGRILCRTADRQVRAAFTPSRRDASGYSFTLRGSGLDIKGPFRPKVTVTISNGRGGETLGTIESGECRVSRSAMHCRRLSVCGAPPEAEE
ncbi:MAG TPA: hypothetical protein VMR79_01795, partial [Verrucomicrobiae bacterium]|nr:hypothetical protein [Verrucomicrobiae bacterium]